MNRKKEIRQKFRDAVFSRDSFMCAISGCTESEPLDAHHITPREMMPNGGYVKENGISLCSWHHLQAETFLSNPGAVHSDFLMSFSPSMLYKIIGSSYDAAVKASEKLK